MRIRHLALAAGVLLLSAGAASATPALVTGDLNLRTGPGTQYGILTVLPDGVTVNVRGCAAGWCRIAWRGGYGFASSHYLDFGGGPIYAAPPPPAYYAPPPVVRFGFSWGGRRWHHDRYRHRDRDRRHHRRH
jgi:uncharacterized protein YraI